MCGTRVRRVRPLLQLSLCMSSKSTTVLTLNNKLHVQASGHLSWGGHGRGCNRSPLIISNTAVAQRLKTKAQLRKELWGWSKPPPPLCAEMEDEKTLDSDCICDFSPLNLHPASVSPASASSFFFFFYAILFSLLLLYHPSASSPFVSLSAELLRNVQFAIWTSLEMVFKLSPATLTYNQKRRTVGNFTVSSLPIKMDCCVTLTVHTAGKKRNYWWLLSTRTSLTPPVSQHYTVSERFSPSPGRKPLRKTKGWLRSRQAVVLAPPPSAFISPS